MNMDCRFVISKMKIDFSNCIKSNAASITIGNIFLLGKCTRRSFRGEWDDVYNSLSNARKMNSVYVRIYKRYRNRCGISLGKGFCVMCYLGVCVCVFTLSLVFLCVS